MGDKCFSTFITHCKEAVYSVFTTGFYRSLPNHAVKHVFAYMFKPYLTKLLASNSLWFSERVVLNPIDWTLLYLLKSVAITRNLGISMTFSHARSKKHENQGCVFLYWMMV